MQNQAARRFVDAVNAGDTDQGLATLTDGAVVVDSGRQFADPTAIRDRIDIPWRLLPASIMSCVGPIPCSAPPMVIACRQTACEQ